MCAQMGEFGIPHTNNVCAQMDPTGAALLVSQCKNVLEANTLTL